MGHSSIRIKARRKKVNALASISRKNTVNNCTIITKKDIKKDFSWENKKHPQCKNLTKKEIFAIFNSKPNKLWKHLSKDEKIDAYVEDKMKRWEKEFPCPVQTSDIQKDLFEQEYLPQWNEDYNNQKEKITQIVTSMFNKVKLFGRFETSPHEYKDELIAEIKDNRNEGLNVNNLTVNAKLVRKAQKIATCCWKKRKNMTCATLKSYSGETGRVLIPDKKAA